MVARGCFSIAPRWRWLSSRLRTLLLVVAVIALLLAGMARGVPWVVWRFQVDRALEATLSAPSLTATVNIRSADFSYLMSDRERVLEELILVVEQGPDDLRRVRALRTIVALLGQPCPPALRGPCLDRLLNVAVNDWLYGMAEGELARAVGDVASYRGLTAKQRHAILARVKVVPAAQFASWARVLAEIGGREEILFLSELGDRHDPPLLNAIHNTSLIGCQWPGLLPAVRSWLADATAAPGVLRYHLLSHTPEGRDLLLAYATDAAHPVELRRLAMERLQKTIPGTKLLIHAAENPAAMAVRGASLKGDPLAAFQDAFSKLEDWNGADFWLELISQLDPAPSGPHRRGISVRCLEWITGRTDIQSQAEWQLWYLIVQPPSLSQRDLVELVLDHPEALESSAVLRRIVPYRLSTMPEECIPLYERMAREGPPASRYWACAALLRCSPRTDVVPIVIDLIAQGDRDHVRASTWGPVGLLRDRFAENFFWDTTAWRKWWAEQGR